MTDLSIVIVNWNSFDLLKKCLQSIKKNVLILNEVWVVDNNSADKSVEMVKKHFSWVKLIVNKENLGFAKANNQALKKIRTKYVLILNPDTEVLKGSIEILLNFLEENKQISVCAPLLLNPDKSIQKKGYYRKFPTLLQAIFFYTDLSKYSFKNNFLVNHLWEDSINGKKITEVSQIPGACIFARTNVLKIVGFFNEKYFVWFEDVELCLRLKKLGEKIVVVPESKIIHVGGGTFKKQTDEVAKQSRFFKSMFLFFDLNKNIIERILIRFIIIGNYLYLVTTKGFKQLITPTVDRKEFVKFKWEMLKCLLA